jgi:hypothetical protein
VPTNPTTKSACTSLVAGSKVLPACHAGPNCHGYLSCACRGQRNFICPLKQRVTFVSWRTALSVHAPFCRHGVSKYTNLGRALVGLCDLAGVRWSRKRTQMPPLVEGVSGIILQASQLEMVHEIQLKASRFSSLVRPPGS